MEILLPFLSILMNFMYSFVDISLFFYLSLTKVPWKNRLFLTSIEVLLSVFFNSVSFLQNSIFPILATHIFFFILSYLYIEKKEKTVIFFYSLFPLTFVSVIGRILTLSFSQLSEIPLQRIFFSTELINLPAWLGLILSFFIFKKMNLKFKSLKLLLIDKKNKHFLVLINISMLFYVILTDFLYFIQFNQQASIGRLRYVIALFYIFLFLSLILTLNEKIRQNLQEQLEQQKNLQLKNMADYSHHIEELYKEVRTFRHDYANILSVLHDGIERRDIAMVEDTYYRVLEQTGKNFHKQKYDFGRLVNVQDDAIKSMISAKLLEAQSKGITISIEVPSPTKLDFLDTLDMLTLLSILLDNAIEGTLEAEHPSITLALIEKDGEQTIIIENTTKEEQINTRAIYKEGVSSKGDKRGLGLATIARIRQEYPSMSIRTKSAGHLFRQTLIIPTCQTPKF